MCVGSKIIKERQKAIRREMDRKGISLTIVSLDSGIKLATLSTYFPADQHKDPVQIPGGAIYQLEVTGALPLEMLNLLKPDGLATVKIPEGVDLEDFAAAILDFQAAKTAAHHPNSEEGAAIGPTERAELEGKVAQIRGA